MPFEVPVVSDNSICWSLFLDVQGYFFLKPIWTTCGDVEAVFCCYFFIFLTPIFIFSLQLSSYDPWESLATQTLCLTVRKDNIDTHPVPGRFLTSLIDWHFLIIALMVWNGDFQCFSNFLTATFYFVKLNNLVLYIRTVLFGFTPCDGWLREFGLCVPHIYNHVEQEVMAVQFHVHNHPGVLI